MTSAPKQAAHAGRAVEPRTVEPRTSISPVQRPRLLPDAPAAAIGGIAHAVLATLAATADTLGPAALTEQCLLTSANLARGSSSTARSNAVVAAGFANRYLQTLMPTGDKWELLGSEMAAGNGRVDLAFRSLVDGSVIYDEIKCAYVPRVRPDQKWVTQCRRYAGAGSRRFGDAFVGVRLLPLGSMQVAALVPLAGRMVPLRPTRSDPLGRRGAS